MADIPEQENEITKFIAVKKSVASKGKKAKKKLKEKRDKLNEKRAKLNKKKNQIMLFLKSILDVLAGVYALRLVVINVFTNEMPKIETYIKTQTKLSLKADISCGINGPIPDYLKSTGPGININLKHIDFLGLYHTDPTTDAGKVLYRDNASGLASTSFDTFLYATIIDGNSQGWGNTTMGEDILTITFLETTPEGNNMINVKVSPYYSNSSNNKNMSDVNNDFIDSLFLFPSDKMVTEVIEGIFSPMSYSLNVPKDWYKKQVEINMYLDKLSTLQESKEIDESFFSFTNEEQFEINDIARDKHEGIRKLESCSEVLTNISPELMMEINEKIGTAYTSSNYNELQKTITTSFDQLTNEISSEASPKDKAKFEAEFFSAVFDGLFKTIGNTLLSPQMIILFQLNNKITYGISEPAFTSPREVIRKNKVIFYALITIITTILASLLVKLIIKKLQELIKQATDALMAEKTKDSQDQLTSLVGTTGDIQKNAALLSDLTKIGGAEGSGLSSGPSGFGGII